MKQARIQRMCAHQKAFLLDNSWKVKLGPSLGGSLCTRKAGGSLRVNVLLRMVSSAFAGRGGARFRLFLFVASWCCPLSSPSIPER